MEYELAVAVLPLVIAGGMLLNLLRERRKLHEAQAHEPAPHSR